MGKEKLTFSVQHSPTKYKNVIIQKVLIFRVIQFPWRYQFNPICITSSNYALDKHGGSREWDGGILMGNIIHTLDLKSFLYPWKCVFWEFEDAFALAQDFSFERKRDFEILRQECSVSLAKCPIRDSDKRVKWNHLSCLSSCITQNIKLHPQSPASSP